ncbi:PspA/IM30 family protein [Variovorax guangxiensis]|uniref:PspA/IM30 family protein n=1 Tax=Variovorax guangxiensis TaxID=1775474 RepID=A0A3S0XK79_9BURK|nr:PspA/IM30 family protein [Variovorax guangxiensis]RUR71933.1 PspA/IM30 family protein [Variovorax guangxiensis]
MGILSKLITQITGALHDLIDKNSDAGRTARQGVRQLDEQIKKAEEGVADVSAELRLMAHNRDKANTDAGKWGAIAKTAAADGNKDEAVNAVHRQVQAEELAASFETHVARLSPMVVQLKDRLESLRKVKIEMQNKTSVLDARSKVAQAESRAARALGNIGTAGGGVDFDRLEESVDREEAKAAALAELAHEKSAANPDAKLADYARREAIGEKLKALGLQPTAAPAGAKAIQGEKNAR